MWDDTRPQYTYHIRPTEYIKRVHKAAHEVNLFQCNARRVNIGGNEENMKNTTVELQRTPSQHQCITCIHYPECCNIVHDMHEAYGHNLRCVHNGTGVRYASAMISRAYVGVRCKQCRDEIAMQLRSYRAKLGMPSV